MDTGRVYDTPLQTADKLKFKTKSSKCIWPNCQLAQDLVVICPSHRNRSSSRSVDTESTDDSTRDAGAISVECNKGTRINRWAVGGVEVQRSLLTEKPSEMVIAFIGDRLTRQYNGDMLRRADVRKQSCVTAPTERAGRARLISSHRWYCVAPSVSQPLTSVVVRTVSAVHI